MPAGIVLADPDGRIRLANSQIAKLLGEPPTFLNRDPGRRAGAHSSTGLVDWIGQPLSRALRGETVTGQDIRWSRQDGSSAWIRISAAPMHQNERRLGAVAVFYDVSEERKVEEALVHQAQELARSNADLEQFAYITSHDLQEPLRTIGLYSQILAKQYEGRLEAEADEFLDIIVTSVDRMAALVRDLLSYSRVLNVNAGAMQAVNMNLVATGLSAICVPESKKRKPSSM